jgi:hypothetical protein
LKLASEGIDFWRSPAILAMERKGRLDSAARERCANRRQTMKVTACIGSSCHLKGSRQVVEELQELVSVSKLKEKVELSGAFCLG